MSIFFSSLFPESPKRSNHLYPGGVPLKAAGEKALVDKAKSISEAVFGYQHDFSISLKSQYNLEGSTSCISLHPVFSFTPDLVPKELLEENVTEAKVKKWLSEQFKEGLSLNSGSFSTTWKIFRWLAKKPVYYDGVRNFILAREFAEIEGYSSSYQSRYFNEVEENRILRLFSIVKHLAPFIPLGNAVLTGNLVFVAISAALLAGRIFFIWRDAKKDKRILLKAVEATGDVKSAIIYYKLLRFYKPRRFDWIRRVTIDRLFFFHDPLRTLSSLKVEKAPKCRDTFSDPIFAKW